jgi:hypothetical protein
MERKMASRLAEGDYRPVASGDPRWWNTTCWNRHYLVKEGLFRRTSPRGIWELSERGIAEIEKRLGRKAAEYGVASASDT